MGMADKSLVDRLVDESDHVNSGWWYVPHELLSAVEVAMRASDRRIAVLTKALRELAEVTALLMSIDDMNSPEYRAARKRRNAALYGARECLAIAVGAEDTNTPKGIQP